MSRDYHAGNHFGPFIEVISFGLVGVNFISNSTWLDFSHPPGKSEVYMLWGGIKLHLLIEYTHKILPLGERETILSLYSLILTRIYLFIIKTGYGEKMCITSFEGDKNKILN